MSSLDDFEKELEHLINKWSLENGVNMPDYAIAAYLRRAYESLSAATGFIKHEYPYVAPSDPAPMKVTWGHGHVYPRIDGALARCGGPALCNECSRDANELTAQRRNNPDYRSNN